MSQAPTTPTTKVALVTGGNKGIGLGICRQLVNKGFRVLLGSRNVSNGKNAIKTTFKEDELIEVVEIDLCNNETIKKTANYIKEKYKQIDVLVNNAGMAFKGDAFDYNVVKTTLNTNYYGTIRVTEAILPLIKKGGRIINVSSRAGAFKKILNEKIRNELLDINKITLKRVTEIMEQFASDVKEDKDNIRSKGWSKTAYGTSKVGMTTYSNILARDNPHLFVAALCPGYVKTDMSSNRGTRNLEQGAWCPVELSTCKLDNIKSGLFWCCMYENELKKQNLNSNDWKKVVKLVQLDLVNPTSGH